MARQRMLHPNLRKDDEMASAVSIAGRYLWEGLWTIADRDGRIPDRPAWIKAELYPYDNVDIKALLAELIEHGCLVAYEVDGKKVLLCRNFSVYHHPHPKEPVSGLPAPVQAIARTLPAMVVSSESESESLTESESKPARAGRSASKPVKVEQDHHSDAVAVVEQYNATFGSKIGPTNANLHAADRSLREGGHGLDDYRKVFEAIRDGTTEAARWCRDKNHAFDYVIRPSYRKGEDSVLGPLEKILNELSAAPRGARPRAAGVIGSPTDPPTLEQIKADYARRGSKPEAA